MIYNSLWLQRWLLHRLLKRQSLSTTVLFRTTLPWSVVLHLLTEGEDEVEGEYDMTPVLKPFIESQIMKLSFLWNENLKLFIPMGSDLFGRVHCFIFLPYFFFVGFSLHSRLPEIWLQRDPRLKPFIVFKKKDKKYHSHGQWSIWQGSLFYVLSRDFFQDFPFTQDF